MVLLKRQLLALVLAVSLVLGFAAPLFAQSDSSIGQGFQTEDTSVVAGAIVSLKSGTPNTVELASSKNLEQMIGVAGSQSLIELSNGASSVQVVTTGNAAVLVSDINGDLRTGDRVTASPIAGVGMRATDSGLVIGTAQSNLSSANAETRTIKDKSGHEQEVKIARISIQVDKEYYEVQNGVSTFLPPVFQDFANNIAGKQVSAVRVMIAGMLVVMLFASVAAVLYSAVRSGIISIGRNPLSEHAVHKSIWQVGATTVAIMVFTLAVIYLILTL